MSYGKAKPSTKPIAPRSAPAYPRTITFSGPKSKRNLKRSKGKSLGRL